MLIFGDTLFEKYLDKAFSVIYAEREDVFYDRKWMKDTVFLLPVVAKSLDDPFFMLSLTDSGKRKLRKRIVEAYKWLAKILCPDIKISERKIKFAGNLDENIKKLIEEINKIYPEYEKAFEKLTPSEKESLEILADLVFLKDKEEKDTILIKYASKVNIRKILIAGANLIKIFDDFVKFLKENVKNFEEDVKNFKEKLKIFDTKFGKFAIGGFGSDVYRDTFAFVIDLGGDDRYCFPVSRGYFSISFVFDLSGDDFYDMPFLSCCGVFGVGGLFDFSGNDFYGAGQLSLGAGAFGLGLLMDFSGNDVYRANECSEGFGFTWGAGLLCDFKGIDVYYAGGRQRASPLLPKNYFSFAQGFGLGIRPDAGGGVGILFDFEGNDFYNAEVYAQGSSYWYSLGILYDGGGSDFYNAIEYAQGAGIHLSCGILVDSSGNDVYFSKFGPSQGEGHDLSCGILMDLSGDDFYYVSGGQGMSLANSFGLLYDREGKDYYLNVEKGATGFSRADRDFGGIALFIDLGGKDKYSKGDDDIRWVQGTLGAGLDTNLIKKKKKKIKKEDFEKMPIEKLIRIACKWGVEEQREEVRLARKVLAERKEEALSFFKKKLGTKRGTTLRALKEYAKANPDLVEDSLIKALSSKNKWIKGNAVYLLGEIKSKKAIKPLLEILKEKKSLGVLRALGKIGDTTLISEILPYLRDKDDMIRTIAVSALGRIKSQKVLPEILDMLSDKKLIVRIAVEEAVKRYKDDAVKEVVDRLKKEEDERKIFHLVRICGKLMDSVSVDNQRLLCKYLFKLLESDVSSIIKSQCVNAIVKCDIPEIKELLEEKMLLEVNKEVLHNYRRIKR